MAVRVTEEVNLRSEERGPILLHINQPLVIFLPHQKSTGIDQSMENHLITEINNSREFAKKLQLLVHQQEPRSFDINSIKSLVNSLTISVEKIMSSAQSAIFEGEQTKPEESPRSVNSPRLQSRSKKRSQRSMEKVTRHVKVTVNTAKGLAGSLEDGYHWRKYGQKGILGTKHPKGYFRCTYSQSRQCLATKHVQMSDEDRAVYDVTYFGEHSCFPGESKNEETVRDPNIISENTESTTSLSFVDTAMLSLPFDMSDWFDKYNSFGLENELPCDPCHNLN